MKLTCNVVGFDIGCHEAIIITIFHELNYVVLIEFVFKEL